MTTVILVLLACFLGAQTELKPKAGVYGIEKIQVEVGKKPHTMGQNVYIVFNRKTKDAVIIDPGASDKRIEKFIETKELKVRMVLNTHGHWDHQGANGVYAKLYKVKVGAHKGDAKQYKDKKNIHFFSDKTIPKIPGIDLKILHTPGHSTGSVCYLFGDLLVSGDTLFHESVGRTFGKSKQEKEKLFSKMISHIKAKLLKLNDKTRVFPGHGPNTTIGWEKKHNPFLR